MNKIKDEFWKNIDGYDGKYQISNAGRVRSYQPQYVINKGYVNTGVHFMKPNDNGHGYKYVDLNGNGFRDRRYVHRLVAEYFLPDGFKTGMEVNHKDGDKSNNRLSNLEWLTPLDNKKHAIRSGLVDNRGSKSTHTHLNDLQATAIKRLHNNKLMTTGEIMALFNVSRHTVLDISSGKSFDYLD